jgi:phenylpyruvate tautomerase PptA (4-oxalocrotonate tautomerase family)
MAKRNTPRLRCFPRPFVKQPTFGLQEIDVPTYTVSSPAGRLSPEVKAKIAKEITRTHNEVTGAQTFFAQVIFHDIPSGDWFVGGQPLQGRQFFIQGQIRGGRTAEMKEKLLLGLRDVLAVSIDVPTSSVWSYVIELPPSQMIEYGHVLPEPGDEAAWLANLPADDRAVIEGVGRNCY